MLRKRHFDDESRSNLWLVLAAIGLLALMALSIWLTLTSNTNEHWPPAMLW